MKGAIRTGWRLSLWRSAATVSNVATKGAALAHDPYKPHFTGEAANYPVCPVCEGYGEIVHGDTRSDNFTTEECRRCFGEGILLPENEAIFAD